MRSRKNSLKLILFLLCACAVPRLWAQGPPYQTDDPVPVDLHHYEFYIFGITDSTPVVRTSGSPAFEFNWGAVPRVQIHAVLPFGASVPSNRAVYQPNGQGPSAFGLTDMELGVKIAFIKETKHFPQIGSFTMFEMPTGSYDKGLGVGKVWYKLPIWFQKNEGKWLFDGGGGYEVVPQAGYRDFPYVGFLVKRELSERLELGAELFAHGREGDAAPQTERSAMMDVGGYATSSTIPTNSCCFATGTRLPGRRRTTLIMSEPAHDAGHVERCHGVAAAGKTDKLSGLGEFRDRLGHFVGAIVERFKLERTKRAVPDQGLAARQHRDDVLDRARPDVEDHVVRPDLVGRHRA